MLIIKSILVYLVYVGTYHSIITCRNSETSIEDCILSIYNQTVKPSYVLVIDDGSTDNTSYILKKMKDRISDLFIITNPDLGYDITRVPFNYNKAISFIKNNQLESTDYHMIASDDAIYERDYADKIIKFMDKNSFHSYPRFDFTLTIILNLFCIAIGPIHTFHDILL